MLSIIPAIQYIVYFKYIRLFAVLQIYIGVFKKYFKYINDGFYRLKSKNCRIASTP